MQMILVLIGAAVLTGLIGELSDTIAIVDLSLSLDSLHGTTYISAY